MNSACTSACPSLPVTTAAGTDTAEAGMNAAAGVNTGADGVGAVGAGKPADRGAVVADSAVEAVGRPATTGVAPAAEALSVMWVIADWTRIAN
ncbi:hypothetical protein GS4_26_00330 [Gordonia soli NBRC 108243]|uniref:Uncharacterized protein n=1 Tax=Gordonia soli NBRC 108243 TaxID=1223545 RepID=M0QLP3_9ACTN|nr:hypothetical protein GS4_26_00330 [Gordonia soli NBRC 108243]